MSGSLKGMQAHDQIPASGWKANMPPDCMNDEQKGCICIILGLAKSSSAGVDHRSTNTNSNNEHNLWQAKGLAIQFSDRSDLLKSLSCCMLVMQRVAQHLAGSDG